MAHHYGMTQQAESTMLAFTNSLNSKSFWHSSVPYLTGSISSDMFGVEREDYIQRGTHVVTIQRRNAWLCDIQIKIFLPVPLTFCVCTQQTKLARSSSFTTPDNSHGLIGSGRGLSALQRCEGI